MKQLPQRTGSEKFINVRYALARYMENKKILASSKEQEVFLTVKPIIVGKENQVQLHLRFKDNGLSDTLDIDFYLLPEEFKRLSE